LDKIYSQHTNKSGFAMRKLPLVVLSLGIILFAVYVSKRAAIPPPVAQEEFVPPVKPLPPPDVDPPRKKTYEEAIADISEDELRKHLEYLCSAELEGRMSGKKGNVVAAEYLKKIYESFGLDTTYQKFNIRRMNPGPQNETGDDFTQNIIAWMEGTELKDEIVVVGAHMDHIGWGPSMSRSGGGKIHPGADDNASGTVALLQIAKTFASLRGQNKRTVVFMSFSAEEMGLIGSRYYCDNPIFPQNSPNIRNHIFMLNMDMVGYLGKARTAVSFNEGESSPDVSSVIRELSGKYSFAKSITGRSSGGSDHACFYNKKVPIAFLHTGMHDHYHTPRDTADKINFSGIEEVAKYGFELTWKIVNSEIKPSFNYGGFQEMEYTHDHGHKDVHFHKD